MDVLYKDCLCSVHNNIIIAGHIYGHSYCLDFQEDSKQGIM